MKLLPLFLAAAPALTLCWLLLLGAAFGLALRRYLARADRLAQIETDLATERQARLLAERALADTHAALGKLVEQRDSARDHERERIARDIHDDLGQNLLVLKLDLQHIHATAPPPVAARLDCVMHNLGLTIKSLRTVINDLRPQALDAGLHTAMAWQVAEFARSSGVRCHLEGDAAAFAACPPLAVDTLLYRVLQESLANVARHAQATEVHVALTRCDGQLTFAVSDNGIGIGIGDARATGCGLHGIRARVAAIGGQFAIASAPGKGTRLSLAIPLQADNELTLSA